MPRKDSRAVNALRPVTMTRHYLKYAEGSLLMEMGETKVICTATVEERVPPFLKGTGTGWVTAEYAMIPRSSSIRIPRDSTRGGTPGRSHEIQRLIGRSLRSVVDLAALGERTIVLDCDVLQADGGTRTAAITGAVVALADALYHLKDQRLISRWPLKEFLGAVSVGIVDGACLLDLAYDEDSTAQVDMNLVMTETGRLVEVQATAEKEPFTREQLDQMMALATKGIAELVERQKSTLDSLLLKVRV